MDEKAANSDESAQAIAAYLAASDVFVHATEALNDGWRRHFEQQADAPSKEWIAEVAAQQLACEVALGRAREATAVSAPAHAPDERMASGSEEQPVARTRRRRRRENTFLASLGRPGKRLLRAALIILFAIALLVATGAGISLTLEVAGFLHLIDDPVQLPVGIQLLIFILAAASAYGLKAALKPVERALYGSKGIRPKAFQL